MRYIEAMTSTEDQMRRAIEQSGETRYRIAQLSGISEIVLSRFANGHTDLTLSNSDKLCEIFGLRLTLVYWSTRKRRSGKS
jgi:transcriptional regulator with XRE-family HTH domain